MSAPPDDSDDAILSLLLAGSPARVLAAVLPPTEETRATLDGSREALAQLAWALPPVTPSVSAREALERRLAEREKPAPRKALVVLDMIEDYLTPGRPLHVPRARAIIPALADRIAAARREGTPVVYLCDRHEQGDPELECWPTHALVGTTGGDVIPELAPRGAEPVLGHRTYSAFVGTDFDALLRKMDVNTLVLTGCATEVGLMATATDALMRGFRVEVPPDCQAGTNELAEQVTLGVLSVMRPVEPWAPPMRAP
jgi:nicotinamidase-related amidase